MWIVAAGLAALLAWRFMSDEPSPTPARLEPEPAREPTPLASVVVASAAPVPVASAAPVPVASAAPVPVASAPEKPAASAEVTGGSGAFDRTAAFKALAANSVKAGRCRSVEAPPGPVTATVTFGPSGRVESARINAAPYAGTLTAKCITTKLSETTVVPFNGPPQSLAVPVQLF
ncbi:MAG: hypothetical protein HYZ29_21740 [Myxococcales bacterium]|nr:hypothetical protein [Myxococcales bacterium]